MYFVIYKIDSDPETILAADKRDVEHFLEHEGYDDIPWKFQKAEDYDEIDLMGMKAGYVFVLEVVSIIPKEVRKQVSYKL